MNKSTIFERFVVIEGDDVGHLARLARGYRYPSVDAESAAKWQGCASRVTTPVVRDGVVVFPGSVRRYRVLEGVAPDAVVVPVPAETLQLLDLIGRANAASEALERGGVARIVWGAIAHQVGAWGRFPRVSGGLPVSRPPLSLPGERAIARTRRAWVAAGFRHPLHGLNGDVVWHCIAWYVVGRITATATAEVAR